MKNTFLRDRRFILLVTTILFPGLVALCPLRVAVAENLTTEAVLDIEQGTAIRGKMLAFLERDDVADQLALQGISVGEARDRVAALTDDELQRIAPYISEMPAAGDGVGAVIGAILIVFIILLFTDILGLTKVFPFTRSINR